MDTSPPSLRVARTRTAAGEIVPVIGTSASPGWVPASLLDPAFADVRVLYAQLDALSPADVPSDGAGPIAAADLCCPVLPDARVFAVGMNYHGHLAELGESVPELPFVFPKSSNSLADPYAEITVDRAVAAQVDYEIELAFVIGATVRDVHDDDVAQAAVAALCVSNDLSAREWQSVDKWVQWLRAKGQDGFCPMGPWATAAPALGWGADLEVRTEVNGEIRQQARTSDMVFGCAQMVRHVSAGLTLRPGDVILTGTPGGTAYGMPGQPWLRDGDRVTCGIEGLGEISNVIRSRQREVLVA